MLSAFAVRKAAQTSRQVSPKPATPEPGSDSEPSPSSRPPSSKRKATEQPVAQPKKKKRKNQRNKANGARYFHEVPQQEMVILASSDSEQSVDSSEEEEEQIVQPTSGRWSPSAPAPESSDEENDDEDEPISAAEPVPSSSKLISSFRPVVDQDLFHLSIQEQESLKLPSPKPACTLVCLRPEEQLGLLGVYLFTVLQGSVSISGVQLSPSFHAHRVFASRATCLPVLIACQGESTCVEPSSIPSRLQSVFRDKQTVIVLHECRTNVEGLGILCKTFERIFYPPPESELTDVPLNLSGVHLVSSPGRDIQPFHLPPSWKEALPPISSEGRSVCLVKGSKKTGKSTFARCLVNNLLTRYQKVAYLECDLGQSEFTPCGMVALNVIESPLFGPPFTHPALPFASHYIGTTSPQSSPSQYTSAIQALMQTYRLDIETPLIEYDQSNDERITATIPLVVNTMGWTKGLGADLSRKIEECVEPTHIFEFDAPIYENSYSNPYQEPPINTVKPFILQHIPSSMQSPNYNAADYRTLAILSYFHAIFPRTYKEGLYQFTAESWDVSLPLCAKRPYQVEFRIAIDKVILNGAGAEDVHSSEIERVLNGAVVGLLACEPGSLDDSIPTTEEASAKIPYSQCSSIPLPTVSNCFGLGLVRAIAPDSSHIHLLSPLPPSLLTRSRVLLKGEVELPVWGMLDFRSDGNDVAGIERNKVPYLQWGKGEGVGSGRRKLRRNLMRRSQM